MSDPNRHFSESELLAYLECDESLVDLGACSRHTSSCDDCGNRVEELRTLSILLSDQSVHDLASQPLSPVRFLRRIKKQAKLRQHIDDARTFLSDQVQQIADTAHPIDVNEQVPIAGALVLSLIREARDGFDRRADRSLRILEAAASVASAISDAEIRIEFVGNVAKEKANVLRRLGQNSDALASLDYAESILSQLPAAGFDLNFVRWARATVLFYMGFYGEAHSLAIEVVSVFREFGEVRYLREAEMLIASSLCEQGRVVEARDSFVALAAYFDADPHMAPRVRANIADCEARLGNFAEAKRHAAVAMAGYKQLDQPAARIRVWWTLGYGLYIQGAHDEALSVLRGTIDEFQTLGLTFNAALVSLDMIEIHVARGDWSAAEQLARGLMSSFNRIDSPIQHAQASQQLLDAVSVRHLSFAVLKEFRASIAPHANAEADAMRTSS